VVARLAPGGSICLNVSNDIFIPGSPARSMYRAYMLVALHERLGLHLMDEIPWVCKSKAPGPTAWASKKRVQLNVAWEPIYWLTNDPHLVMSDNRRVLKPHTDRHLKLLQGGGEQRSGTFGDGANTIRPGSFGNVTAGTIPKNVIEQGNRCGSQVQLRKMMEAQGLPVHGATMPLKLARFLVDFLTVPGQLVVDTFGGWCTTAVAAEEGGRRWLVAERMRNYLVGGAMRFQDAPGFERGPALA
jgi:site-specific DNA-methyltransferase (cytosine-N4-specific)